MTQLKDLAIFATLAIPVFLALSPCGVAQAPAFTGELPIVAGAGEAPPTKETFVLEIGGDGKLTQAGKGLDAEELRARLAAFARRYPDSERKLGKSSLSRGQLFVRLHPELPCGALTRVQEFCAQPDVLIDRLFLAVRSKKDGPERAIRLFLPVDGTLDETPTRELTVAIRHALPPLDPKALQARLDELRARTGADGEPERSTLVFRPDADVTVASVLRVAHLVRRGGFDQIAFHGTAGRGGTAPDLEALAARRPNLPARAPGVAITVGGMLGAAAKPERKEWTFHNTAVGLGGESGGVYGGRRRRPNPDQIAAKNAIDKALEWLAARQDKDGRWDADGFMKHEQGKALSDGKGNARRDIGVTGLALLAFLGDGSTLRSGPYKETVKKGIKWLRNQQEPSGLIGSNATHDFIYGHAIATMAMCEAYGLSEYRVLKKTAQKAINYLEQHRNPRAAWRYMPRDGDNDMSVTSWCIAAYRSARDFDLEVNPAAFRSVGILIDEWTDPTTGHCGYTKRGEPSSRQPGDHATRFPVDKGRAMTAAALFSRFMLGQAPARTPVMKLAADTILGAPPKWDVDGGTIDFYYWYYGSYAMYQMGGKHWTQWMAAMQPLALKHQREDGNFAGSWDPVGVWGSDGGRVYSTAMMALTLEAVYRYGRLVK